MERYNDNDESLGESKAHAEPSVLDRKRPVARFPDSFSANLGRKASHFFHQENSTSESEATSFPPIPESQGIINRKRDIIPGTLPPLLIPRDRQTSAASSVKAMVAHFESNCNILEKPENMADSTDQTASSSSIEKGKGKASIDAPTYSSSPFLPMGPASQAMQPLNDTTEESELELLKMQEFFKTNPLTRCLDDYVPPKSKDEKINILPTEQDEGESMLKAAKLELHNRLASSYEAYEKRHPSAKLERLENEASEALRAGQPYKKGVSSGISEISTKASRRAQKKAQKKAEKKANKAAKREDIIAIHKPQAPSASATEKPAEKPWSLREQYPETFAKIDYYRSLPDPDKPQSSLRMASEQSVHETCSLSNSSTAGPKALPLAKLNSTSHAQTICGNSHIFEGQNKFRKDLAHDSTDYDDSGASKTDVESSETNIQSPVQETSQPSVQPLASWPSMQSAQREFEGGESFSFIQREPKEELSDEESVKKSKTAAVAKKKEEFNRRAHEAVNAAHAEGRLVHLENTKPIRDQVITEVRKSDIVPGFDEKKKLTPTFDEEAYAARSIACHTLKPAPLRIPSRTKEPTADSKDDAKAPPPPIGHQSSGALQLNTTKYRITSSEIVALEGDYHGKVGDNGRKGSITQPNRRKNSAVNFSWPNAQQAQKMQDHIVSEDPSTSLAGKKENTLPAYASEIKKPGTSGSSKKTFSSSYNGPSRAELNDFFGTKTQAGQIDYWLANELQARQNRQSAEKSTESVQSTARQSFKADEYQSLIQDDFNHLVKESPEKKKQTAKTKIYSISNDEKAPKVVPQTVIFNGQYPQPQRLAGTAPRSGTALPPTPACTYRPQTTGEKMDALDDFFSEESDDIYPVSGSAATPTTGLPKQQPWDEPGYHEEALAYGYAYQQNNHDPLPDSMNPVPLTRSQRRHVLASYGMTEADYPAPPAGYPTPSGPADGEAAPPCPTRPPPTVPTPSTEGGNGQRGQVASLRRAPRRLQRAATAPSAPESPAPGYDADWF
ncbi:uncharacterized protein CTRU02_200061 [Colletotrichum truncatum]|uniref:Uncharacterized protein n=1 Tax=Colletotrichum truncatum TaxID=5467 RepID=A0ACC3ZDI1_COLTU|nr:uncharacterized protein CTRU02_04936 [Colletotrichum truncatum]KAF6794735.1 hypothetical protein CTRU02_04936 [Colletotrichum truncatum]